MEDKMRLSHIVVPSLLAFFAAAPVQAQEAARYQLEKTANGYVRMDTETGAMSSCEEKSGQLVCRMAADERAAAMDEIDRLNRSIEDLNGRVTKLENSLAAKLESSLPSEEELNKTMSYMERFLRGFLGIVKDMEKDNGGDAGKPAPQKT
jgi:transcription elongation factor